MTSPMRIEGGVLAPYGFAASSVAAGLKKGNSLDLTLLVSTSGRIPSAAVFTQSATAAPPIQLSRASVADGAISAAVVNSGNANACTGARGMADAETTASLVAAGLGCDASDVIVSSTGVIGVPMPMELISHGVAAAIEGLSSEAVAPVDAAIEAARAIMTTDTFEKQYAVSVGAGDHAFRVGGMAKGSGMIHPNMATMLGFITTDAPLTSAACDAALREAVSRSFNRITVDGDTSTNDMVLLMASGAVDCDPIDTASGAYPVIVDAITSVATELAKMIVRDGEGATKFIEVRVEGASSEADAQATAMAIATSPLFKTAIFGGDANWGRVAMAVGNSQAAVDPERLEVTFAGITTCMDGQAVPFDEDAASAALSRDEIEVAVDLHLGEAKATVWTCDLSYEYVRINGEYRT